MQTVADRPPTAIRTDLGAIFLSLELSRSTWLITSLSPGGGEKMSKQVMRGGDVAELLEFQKRQYVTRDPMKLSLAEATVLRKTVACIPGISQTISETAKNHRESSLEKVEQPEIICLSLSTSPGM
jgi:hypothetical protein